MVFLLCWVAMRMMLQEALIFQENVEQFDTAVLLHLIGHLYHLDVTVVWLRLAWFVFYLFGWMVLCPLQYPVFCEMCVPAAPVNPRS